LVKAVFKDLIFALFHLSFFPIFFYKGSERRRREQKSIFGPASDTLFFLFDIEFRDILLMFFVWIFLFFDFFLFIYSFFLKKFFAAMRPAIQEIYKKPLPDPSFENHGQDGSIFLKKKLHL